MRLQPLMANNQLISAKAQNQIHFGESELGWEPNWQEKQIMAIQSKTIDILQDYGKRPEEYLEGGFTEVDVFERIARNESLEIAKIKENFDRNGKPIIVVREGVESCFTRFIKALKLIKK